MRQDIPTTSPQTRQTLGEEGVNDRVEDIHFHYETMIERVDLVMDVVEVDWGCCQRIASWAALIFLWGLGVFEFLILSLVQSY